MITQIATHQLHQRQRHAQRVVNRAQNPREHSDRIREMNRGIAPWFAAAVLCGADISRLAPDQHAELQDEIARQPRSATARQREAAARSIVALRYSDTEEMRAEIAASRDAAIHTQSDQAGRLAMLAKALGCPDYQLEQERTAA